MVVDILKSQYIRLYTISNNTEDYEEPENGQR